MQNLWAGLAHVEPPVRPAVKILPLKTEIAAAKAVIEDESFESADDMAKECVRVIARELAKRDSFCIALRTPTGIEAFWPFLYEADARRFNDQYPGLPTERRYVLRMRSSVMDLATQDRHQQQAKDAGKHLAWIDKHRAVVGAQRDSDGSVDDSESRSLVVAVQAEED